MSQASETSPRRRPRAWWQWALGICLLGVAVVSLGFRAYMHFWPELLFADTMLAAPIPLKLPDGMKDAPAIPAKRGDFAGHNVLLVTLDTTRADRLGCYGNTKIETPTLDRLAREGVLFSKAIMSGPTTLPSHASILTGLFPHRHGARANSVFRLKEDRRTLAEIFSEQGYATGAAISAFVLDSRYGLARGFDEYDDALSQASEHILHGDPERTADDTTDVAISWIKRNQDRPFFYWIHYFDPHQPYEPPGRFAEEYAHFPYDGEIAFVDTELTRLLDFLDEVGVGDKTLIVVIGDHGQGLGQHNEITHGFLLYDSTLQVPFIMACGTRLGGGVHVPRLVTGVDVFPTVLSLLGISEQVDCDGIDLTSPIPESRVVLMETLEGLNQFGSATLLAIREGDLKYIHGPIPELFDLADDPHESNDLLSDRADDAGRLLALLEQHYGDDLDAAAYPQPTEQLSDDDMRMLAALGYTSIGISSPPEAGSLPDPKELLPLFYEVEHARHRLPNETVEDSIKRLRSLVDRHPDFYLGLRQLATAYTEAGDLENAKVYYNRCVELHPDSPFPLFTLARIAAHQGDVEEAIRQYENAILRSPDFFPALSELGKLYLRHNQPRKASHLLLKACTIRPTDQNVIETLGAAMQRADRVEEAVLFFKDRLEKKPRLHRVRNVLSVLLIGLDECEESVSIMREGAALHPENQEVLATLSFVLIWCESISHAVVNEAIAIMEDLCQKTDYNNPYYLRTLSMAYGEQLRLDEAITLAERGRQIAMDRGLSDLVDMLDTFLVEYRDAKRMGITPGSIRGTGPITTQPAEQTD